MGAGEVLLGPLPESAASIGSPGRIACPIASGSPEMQPRDHDFAGLDVVRLFALGLVTVQHALTLMDRETWCQVAGLSIGQIGVALFLAVSGLLASASRRPPLTWLLQRFRRLFPAYWIAIASSFALAWLGGHKSFDIMQVVAQFLGIGLFTHGPTQLVNTPTWYVSLLLVCYLGSVVARLMRMPVLLGVVTSLALAVAVGTVESPWLLSHLFTYTLAYTLAHAPRALIPPIALIAAVVLFAAAYFRQPAFAYTALALVAVEVVRPLRTVLRPIRTVAAYSYEYYLVHGVFLYGFIRSWPSAPWLATGCAIVVAAVAAVVLHFVVKYLERIVIRMWSVTRNPAPEPAASTPPPR